MKLSKIFVLILSIVNAIAGIIVGIFEIIDARYFYDEVEAIASFFVCFTLIASAVFAIMLAKDKLEGAVLSLSSSLMVLIFGFTAQVGEVIFYDFTDPAIRLIQVVNIVFIVVYLSLKNNVEEKEQSKVVPPSV